MKIEFTNALARASVIFSGLTVLLITMGAVDCEANTVTDLSEADSVAYYEKLLSDRSHPEEFERARQWLNRYYRDRVNYDEELIPDYTLPEILISSNGNSVTDPQSWVRHRQPEILKLYEEQVYGRVPEFDYTPDYLVRSVDRQALGGKATRKQIAITFEEAAPELTIEVLVYLPNHQNKPVPAMMGLSFYGNHTVHDDPDILMSDKWMRPNETRGIRNNRATEASRGTSAEAWQVEKILERGYALVTAYSGDIEPDEYNRMRQGVRSLAYPAQENPGHDEWGTLAAWAWGLSRIMDYLETDLDVDHARVALMGHSRLGKAALWAGATDERFAIVISNNSGCGGAALSMRRFGETIGVINTSFPHWFNQNFNQYNGREENLPVDQHMLIALMAPRPVYVASAEEDPWADPKGEFLSAREASVVYELFGMEGLNASGMPEVDRPVKTGTIGYHVRSGRHAVTEFDWRQYLDFADRHFK